MFAARCNPERPSDALESKLMRRSAAVAALFSLTLFFITLATPAAAVGAYDSQYQFESAFLANLKPSDTGTFSVFFANIGTVTWVVGTTSQVNLAVCAADKVTCNVASPQATWASGWLSS